MTLTTTTYHLIRDQMVTKVAALTPTLLGSRKFKRANPRHQIRDWSAVAQEAGFRAFEITRAEASEPALMDPAAFLRRETVTVIVAYPILRAIYGSEDLDSIENTIRSDTAQIRDALYSSGNYVTGQQAAIPLQLPETDRASDEVWFQSIPFDVLYYEAQTLV